LHVLEPSYKKKVDENDYSSISMHSDSESQMKFIIPSPMTHSK
jgi:hypothetical protein